MSRLRPGGLPIGLLRQMDNVMNEEGLGPFGVAPISGDREIYRIDEARTLLPRAPTLAIGINLKAILEPGAFEPWIAEAGIVTAEGFALFDFAQVKIENALPGRISAFGLRPASSVSRRWGKTRGGPNQSLAQMYLFAQV
ncbi:hypothetical protein AU381_23040 [Sinorhizobium glycinis]|uniref:Uncharacterized protein n=2 Tax=Sinorhizobium glycinis TaxID=1472378 RepID=A0A178XVB8_9HYPH|nr:hypothetical protein AU381_23040 [Sinorhizobium glycinis]